MAHRRPEGGQALFEFGVILPIMLVLILGALDVCYALFQAVVIRSLAREGSNVVSRNHTIDEAETAISAAATTGPVHIDANTKVFLSVVTLGTSGGNNGQPIIVQRHAMGSLGGVTSQLGNPPQASYGGSPDYKANNPGNDTSIRISGPLPNGFSLAAGETIYVTEVFTRRTSIAPYVPLPATLSTGAYF